MKKNFTFVLPDEPYKTETKNNNVVNATYEGSKYLIFRIDNITNQVYNAAAAFDRLDEFELANYNREDGITCIVVDAAINTFEAAYITGNYTHEEIPDPVFVLPNNLGEWTYHYDDFTNGMAQCFLNENLTYNFETETFSPPAYRAHAILRDDFINGYKNYADAITASLDNSDNEYSDSDRTKLEEYVAWLKNLDKTYKGIDHWKIPFSADIPQVL